MNEIEQKLFLAIKNGHNQWVLQLLQSESIDINVKNEKKLTPLMLACQLKNRAVVETLVKQESIDLSCHDGGANNFTALMHYMVDNKSTENSAIVDILFDSNKLSPEDNNLALIHYASIGDLEKVKQCLEEKQCDINYQHRLFESALLKAVTANQIAVVRYLLAVNKININCLDYLNRTPLHIAIENEFEELIPLFLDRKDIDLHVQSYLLGTPLVAAIYLEQSHVALQLLDKEKVFKNELHPRAVLCAIEKDAIDVLEKLIECGANINLTGEEGYKRPEDWVWQERMPSPFDPFFDDIFELPIIVAVKLAIEEQQIDALKILIAHNADLTKEGVVRKSANQLLQDHNTSIAKLLPVNVADHQNKSAPLTQFFSIDAGVDVGINISTEHAELLEELLKASDEYLAKLKKVSVILSQEAQKNMGLTLIIKDFSVLEEHLKEMKKGAIGNARTNNIIVP